MENDAVAVVVEFVGQAEGACNVFAAEIGGVFGDFGEVGGPGAGFDSKSSIWELRRSTLASQALLLAFTALAAILGMAIVASAPSMSTTMSSSTRVRPFLNIVRGSQALSNGISTLKRLFMPKSWRKRVFWAQMRARWAKVR